MTSLSYRATLAAALMFPGTASLFAATVDAQAAHHRVQVEGTPAEGIVRPTVVLEGGLGDTLDVWNDVQPSIVEHCTRALAYNRAGYPGSEPAKGARDAATIVAELRGELQRRHLAPPYVLVGHSLGGLYMQYFARQYPDEVAGLVLVDSTHWSQQLRMGSTLPGASNKRSTVVLFMSFIARRELADSAKAGEQVHESPPAGFVPTIVLSSTGVLRGETPASRTEAARLQEDIVADFPAARQVRVDGSGHYIQKDRPDTVITAVRELVGCNPHG